MKKKTADELKECAAMVKSARNEVTGLQELAQWVDMAAGCLKRTLDELADSIESLPNFEDIDIFNRHRYHRERIRTSISEILNAVDLVDNAPAMFKKAAVRLQKKTETALRQVETQVQNHRP